MAVVFLTSSFPASVGGVDMVLVRRARELARLDDVVAVVPTPWAPPPVAALSPRWARHALAPRAGAVGGIAVLRPRYLQVPGTGAAAGFGMALGALATVRRLRAAGRCDVLFAQSVVPDGLAAALLGRVTGTPATCLGRGTDVHDVARSRVVRRLVAYTVARSAGVAVVAGRLAATLAPLAGARAITVIPDGVDLERFVPGDRAAARRTVGLDPAARVVAYVGRLVAGKGIDTLLDALPAIARAVPAAQLVLVGGGPLATAVAATAERLGMAARVRVAGEVAHDDVPAWLQAADVVALPSVAEGFPNSVREALACGRPVVATPVGDLPRIITPETGRLVPVGDSVALADALVSALGAEWSPSAIRSQVASMTWEANARATHAFLAAARSSAGGGVSRLASAAPGVPGGRRTA